MITLVAAWSHQGPDFSASLAFQRIIGFSEASAVLDRAADDSILQPTRLDRESGSLSSKAGYSGPNETFNRSIYPPHHGQHPVHFHSSSQLRAGKRAAADSEFRSHLGPGHSTRATLGVHRVI